MDSELIEEAAAAIHAVAEGGAPWLDARMADKDQHRAEARAALAVFEAAQKPAGDEREARLEQVRVLVGMMSPWQVSPEQIENLQNVLGGLRRHVSPEPSAHGCCLHDAKVVERPDFEMPEYLDVDHPSGERQPAWPEPQTEPTDARRVCPQHGYTCPSFTYDHPTQTEPTTVQLMARRGGKTQALIESMLAQANERGIRVEIVHPEQTTDRENGSSDAR